jgi:hypothetical protein
LLDCLLAKSWCRRLFGAQLFSVVDLSETRSHDTRNWIDRAVRSTWPHCHPLAQTSGNQRNAADTVSAVGPRADRGENGN